MSWLHRNASGLATSAHPTPPTGDPGSLATRAQSPHGKRTSEAAQGPPKPPRLTTAAASPTPSISPLSKRRRSGEARSLPALKVNIPTILVEDEPMEVDGGDDDGVEVRGCRSRARSPVEGGGNGSSACPVFCSATFFKPRPLSYILFSVLFQGVHWATTVRSQAAQGSRSPFKTQQMAHPLQVHPDPMKSVPFINIHFFIIIIIVCFSHKNIYTPACYHWHQRLQYIMHYLQKKKDWRQLLFHTQRAKYKQHFKAINNGV